MKKTLLFVAKTVLSGFLIIVPVYLTALLVMKAMAQVAKLVQPVASLVPDTVPAEKALSLLLVILLCFLVGLAVLTQVGRAIGDWIEKTFLQRIPGYAVVRSLTHQLAGESREQTWKPALAEIEEALVPAFIIEEFDDGRYTVFVPSIPTPLAGAVYILERRRVHLLDVPFTRALQVVSRWGSGAQGLDAAMRGRAGDLRDERDHSTGSADAA